MIAHEFFYMIFEWFGDCDVTNTDSAECYEMFAREMGGTAGATTSIGCCKPPAETSASASAAAAEVLSPLIPGLPSIPGVPREPFVV